MRIAFYRRRSGEGEGGANTFQSTVLSEIARRSDLPFDSVIISETGQPPLEPKSGMECFIDPERSGRGASFRALRALRNRSSQDTPLDVLIRSQKIALTWFLGSFQQTTFPKVITLFDLEHRFHPMFPEVSRYGWTWQQREDFYRNHLPSSTFVICGTEQGGEEVVQCYGVARARVRVIPLPVPDFVLEQTKDPELPQLAKTASPYLFYPAQCWPHKNHIAILHALRRLDARGSQKFSAVFAGASKENRDFVEAQAASLGLSGRVIFLGFCDEPMLKTLYRSAYALVYPSYFGPDNLPPLEAFALGCPVIAAAVPGASEQLGDAALLFNPSSDEQLADKIASLASEPPLRSELIAKGRQRIAGRLAKDYVDGITKLATELIPIFRCWDQNNPGQYRC